LPDLKFVESRWLITILYDYSHCVVASQILDEGRSQNTIWLLDKAIHESTRPRAKEEKNPDSTHTTKRRRRTHPR